MSIPARDDVLSRAARALREQVEAEGQAREGDGDAVASWQGMRGWYDISRDVKQAARRRRVALIVGLQLGLALTGVGAWAAVSGRLAPLFSRLVPASRTTTESAPAKSRAPAQRRGLAKGLAAGGAPARAPAEVPPSLPSPAPRAAPAAPAPSSQAAPPRPSAVLPPPHPPASERPPASGPAVDVEALYREAHAAHFLRKDYAAALTAWDRYLAAGGGAFVLEARYNRAIALVRLGLREEAIAALRPFASGEVGGYRQDEAEALLHKLGSSPPP